MTRENSRRMVFIDIPMHIQCNSHLIREPRNDLMQNTLCTESLQCNYANAWENLGKVIDDTEISYHRNYSTNLMILDVYIERWLIFLKNVWKIFGVNKCIWCLVFYKL